MGPQAGPARRPRQGAAGSGGGGPRGVGPAPRPGASPAAGQSVPCADGPMVHDAPVSLPAILAWHTVIAAATRAMLPGNGGADLWLVGFSAGSQTVMSLELELELTWT